MQSSAFAAGDIGVNYDIFKKNFIEIFGGGNKPSIVRQVAQTVDTLQANASSKPLWDGMVIANQLAADCIKSLKDSHWIQGGQMSEGNVKKFLEFFSYTFLVPEKSRRAALTLNYKTGGKLVDFISDLEIKVQESPHNTDIKSEISAPVQVTCYFCKQPGHVEANCFAKKKDAANKSGYNRNSTDRKPTGPRQHQHKILLLGSQGFATSMGNAIMTQKGVQL